MPVHSSSCTYITQRVTERDRERWNNDEPTDHDEDEYDENENDVSGGEVEGEVGSLCRTILLVPAELTVPAHSTHGAKHTLGLPGAYKFLSYLLP